ncbi:MAG TPA: pyridoxamine 5'-phosphate oxidase family protein [bacterium]|nr:pyridoxamine 5'-phosphate oxidase family protein [bacterium]
MGVELTPAEIDAYLLSAPRAILCVTRDDRPPLPLPMWFGWAEGCIVMHTLASSRKVPHIRRHPEVSCLVESGEDYYSLKAVLVLGHCDVVDDPGEVKRWIERMNESKPLYRQLRPSSWPEHLQRHYAKPRVALVVTPVSITSWDFAKICR